MEFAEKHTDMDSRHTLRFGRLNKNCSKTLSVVSYFTTLLPYETIHNVGQLMLPEIKGANQFLTTLTSHQN